MFIDNDFVKRMKAQYPPGTRIRLDSMGDDPHPIKPGTKGTVKLVDDIGTGPCALENGRHRCLCPGLHLSPVSAEHNADDSAGRVSVWKC